MSVAGREFDCKRRMTFLCRAWASGSSRSFRIHERVVPPRAEELDEHIRQLQQGAEIKEVGNHRLGEEGGEPVDAHQ